MGKIVKYCNACEEGFAEKFGFCPNCGAQLTAFEMNPVVGAKPETLADVDDVPVPEVIASAPVAPVVEETAPERTVFEEPPVASEPVAVVETAGFEIDDEVFEDEVPEEQVISEPVPTMAFSSPAPAADLYNATYHPQAANFNPDAYHITIVEEKNVKQRNLLLLGFFVFFFGAFGVGVVYSMFSKFLDVAAIDTPDLISYVGEVEPIPFEEQLELKKDKDKGGGGGGGGKEEQDPASKGREAAQVPDPLFAPTSRSVQLTNPDLAILIATQNKNAREAEKTDEPYGLKVGGDRLSDGPGSGGGLGTGRGRGQGSGEGGGLGSGSGGGRGSGTGGGEGGGTGPGGDEDFRNTTVKVGPTVGLAISYNPKPGYTDAARIANTQGTVTLNVTFLASGQIGAVSVVSGLPNGLNEKAIAAAKSIRFVPAKKNGVPYTVNKRIAYSFTIY